LGNRFGRITLATLALPLVAYVIWGRIESSRLSREIADIQRRGEPIDLASWEKRPQTEEQRRCAGLYAEAAARAQENTRDEGFRFLNYDVDSAVPPFADLAELEATFRRDDPALQLLDQATPLDFDGFDPGEADFDVSQLRLTTLNALNALRADLCTKQGDGDAAATALVASVRLQRATCLPGYRSQSVSRLLGSLRILLRHTSPSEESLVNLQRAFESVPEDDGLAREAMRRRAQFLEALDGPGGNPAESIGSWVFRPLIVHYGRRHVGEFGETIAIARQSWPAKLDAALALTARFLDPAQWKDGGRLRGLIERGPPALAIIVFNITAAALDVAGRHIAVAVLALERYRRAHGGSPAPSLETLVPAFIAAVPQDPFSGKPLIYRQQPDGYVVYNVDINRADDAGVLYGFGATVKTNPRGPQSSRDLGIRVPFKPQR
jgi:hypothetical protein